MFTGIIQATGSILSRDPRNGFARLGVELGDFAAGSKPGDSIAVNGVCLTLVERDGPAAYFDVVQETMARTNLMSCSSRVNLELPLSLGDRLDGHLVQGHVDGTAELTSRRHEGESRRLSFRLPPELEKYVVEKGSVAVNGISLTVASTEGGHFEAAVIPHTWSVTNLSSLEPGEKVNIEIDIIARYVERMALGYLDR